MQGDIVKFGISSKKEWNKNSLTHKVDVAKLPNISKISGLMTAMCILEKADDKVAFVAGEAGIVYVFSLENKELMDLWPINQYILAIDCLASDNGGTIVCMGCHSGELMIRLDWEEVPHKYNTHKPILDLKFSSNAMYLAAACEDGKMYLFQQTNNNFFHLPPKE
jgi:hypothetical protein